MRDYLLREGVVKREMVAEPGTVKRVPVKRASKAPVLFVMPKSNKKDCVRKKKVGYEFRIRSGQGTADHTHGSPQEESHDGSRHCRGRPLGKEMYSHAIANAVSGSLELFLISMSVRLS